MQSFIFIIKIIKIKNIPIRQEKNDIEQINNNEINNQLIEINDIKSEFNSHPLIGLQLIGDCPYYINSVLQCFCQSEKFINYFKYNRSLLEVINKYNNKNQPCLSKAFKSLIENLWPSKIKFIKQDYCHKNNFNKYYAPYEIIETITTISPIFDGKNQAEAKNFINFLIIKLNEELNKNQNRKNLFNNNLMPNQSNKNEMLNFFVNNIMKENISFISDNFYGTNQTQIECSLCKIKKYNYEINTILIFPLDEVIKHKLLINANNQNNNIITLKDCFEFNQKIHILSGENAIPCDNCKLICTSNYQTLIYTFPEILIIILEKNKNSKIQFEIEEKLRLKNYILESQTGYKFKLFGIVSKFVDGCSNEHYFAFCKSPIDNYWYRYNNDFVSKVNNFEKEIKDSICPFILFYQKLK